jgi:hypothetical protein
MGEEWRGDFNAAIDNSPTSDLPVCFTVTHSQITENTHSTVHFKMEITPLYNPSTLGISEKVME